MHERRQFPNSPHGADHHHIHIRTRHRFDDIHSLLLLRTRNALQELLLSPCSGPRLRFAPVSQAFNFALLWNSTTMLPQL